MDITNYIHLLKNPENIDSAKTQQLDEVISEFPYFQSARALLLKGLNKTNSYKYNPTLKKTAAYTIDRNVLFDFITSPTFKHNSTNEVPVLEDIEVIEVETVQELHKKITDSVASKILEIETETTKETVFEEKQKASTILELGKPIQFNSNEPHSFNEWMQLIIQKPIIREDEIENKFSIIDKFIESNPKIKPLDKNLKVSDISLESSTVNESLMTETLAKVYLEQMKYENAIKAYRILSLKYPEKSGFFADQIKAIKILQKNKS